MFAPVRCCFDVMFLLFASLDSRDRQRNLETTSPFVRLITSELSMNGVSRGEIFGAIFAIK